MLKSRLKTLRMLIALAALMGSFSVQALDCAQHPIYCHMKQLPTRLTPAERLDLSNTIHKVARTYELNPRQIVAILFQESRLDPTIARIVHKNGSVDLGIAQINLRTAKNYGLDIERLEQDNHYSIWAMARILKRKISVCRRLGRAPKEEWGCYHSYTKKYHDKYIKSVRRWM